MTNQLFNWATAGLVAASIALPASTALAQRSRGDEPATGTAVARDPAPSPAPSPAPATASGSGGRSDGGSSRSGGDSGDRSGTASGRSRAASGGDGGTRNGGRDDGAATGSRPRGDRNPTGQVVERRPGTGGGGNTIIIPGGGYYPWGWGGLGFGGFYSGYYGGFYDPWGYDPYQGGGGGVYYSGNGDDGSLRIKVKPRDAAVYIDGYFAGTVDDFDGAFQRLHIDGGPHRIEIRADGYQPLTFEVNIQPDRTVTYKGELEKIRN